MNLNLDYYKSDKTYDNSISLEEEEEIIEYINKFERSNYHKILEENNKTAIFTAFSDNVSNVINWYDFKKDCNILQICARFGEITGELSKKAKNVIVCEPNIKRAKAISKRYYDINNIEVYCGNIEEIALEEKFDYIILSGVLKNNNSDIDESLLSHLKTLLNENAHILITVNNKFGVKNFSGVIENLNESSYDSILGKSDLYSKHELKKLLEKSNMNKYKFYYMLPDYKLTNVIFSDDYLPYENDTKIMYNKYCNEKSIFSFDEVSLLKELTKSNNFDIFCNSYFIDIFSDNTSNIKIKCNPKFVSFNNMRKNKFRLITKMYDEFVIKEARSKESLEHIEQIGKNIELLKLYGFDIIDLHKDNKIFSKYMDCKTYDKILLESIKNNDIKQFYYLIDKWYNHIKDKLVIKNLDNDNIITKNIFSNNNILVNNELLNEMNFIKDGFIDLVFENTFFDNDALLFYDQEWYLENIPIEFILYRALNSLFSYNSNVLINISKDEIFEHYKISNYIEIFVELEKVFQNYVIDENIRNFYSEVYGRNLENHIYRIKDELAQEINIQVNKIENLKQENNIELDKLKNEYELKISDLEMELNYIKNSRVWKYTNFLRKK